MLRAISSLPACEDDLLLKDGVSLHYKKIVDLILIGSLP